MARVGSREIVFTQTFLLPLGETATFAAPAEKDSVDFEMQFARTSEPLTNLSSWRVNEEGVIELRFTNWTNGMVSTFTKPLRIGHLGTVPFGFNMAHFAAGTIDVVTMQVYVGGEY